MGEFGLGLVDFSDALSVFGLLFNALLVEGHVLERDLLCGLIEFLDLVFNDRQ